MGWGGGGEKNFVVFEIRKDCRVGGGGILCCHFTPYYSQTKPKRRASKNRASIDKTVEMMIKDPAVAKETNLGSLDRFRKQKPNPKHQCSPQLRVSPKNSPYKRSSPPKDSTSPKVSPQKFSPRQSPTKIRSPTQKSPTFSPERISPKLRIPKKRGKKLATTAINPNLNICVDNPKLGKQKRANSAILTGRFAQNSRKEEDKVIEEYSEQKLKHKSTIPKKSIPEQKFESDASQKSAEELPAPRQIVNRTVWDMLMDVVRKEGVAGLYKGITPLLIGNFISYGVYFFW